MTVSKTGVGLFGTESAPRMVRLMAESERLGFDRCWVGDSQNIWRECYSLIGAGAVTTERL
ncbi:MAG: LLM class flavin-dependent oxidoreductase, partial [Acidimicrobiia bacterium]